MTSTIVATGSLPPSSDEPSDDPEPQKEYQGGKVERSAAEPNRWDHASNWADQRRDDPIQQLLETGQGMTRRHRYPGEEHPGKHRVEIDVERSSDEVEESSGHRSIDIVELVGAQRGQAAFLVAAQRHPGRKDGDETLAHLPH